MNDFKRCGLGISLLTFMVLFVTPGYADDLGQNNETLVFLGNQKLAPLIYTENSIAKGVVVDIAQALGEKIGHEIEIIAMDWTKAQNKLLSGEADALLHINSSPAREEIYDFSDELLRTEISIFRRNYDNHINTLADLEGKQVGVEAKGYPYYLLNRHEHIDVIIVPSWSSGFEMVASGELDAIVVDRWIGEYELAKSGLLGVHVVNEPINITSSHIAVNKNNEQLLDLINIGLENLNEDGTMSKIINNWQGKNVIYVTQESVIRTLLYVLISILIVLALISLFFVFKFRKLNHELEQKVAMRTQELNEANERLRNVNAELEKISRVDNLTQIYNRRGFATLYQKSWAMSIRDKLPLTLIMTDIDHFKSYNDKYGHLAGDQCLQKVSGILKKHVRRSGDVVARYGGEEFIIVLFNTNEDGGVIVAENIRKEIEKLVINYESIKIDISASFGVASIIPTQGMESSNLIKLADRALYQAKENGRNRVARASMLENGLDGL